MSKKLIQAAAGAGGESVYVEDVFSIYLYEGNSGTQSINNGIDLSGEGGLVWLKSRTNGAHHELSDTARGVDATNGRALRSNDTSANVNGELEAFNSNGFTLGFNTADGNSSGQDYCSWTFRKQAGFFDVVSYTGNGSVQSVNHNLGSVPACMIVKRTDSTGDWYVYHVDLGAGINGRKALKLNETSAASDSGGFSDHPTDTAFTVNYAANTSGATYVAYLFAHDDQSFGDNSDESIIKCGSYTGNNTAGNTITLGWEPQWILVKNATTGGTADDGWWMVDNMRGWTVGNDKTLQANTSSAEDTYSRIDPTATGFSLTTGGEFNQSGDTYIYIAIRRPMKTPEAGTDVFDLSNPNTTRQANVEISSNLSYVDMFWTRFTGLTDGFDFYNRLRGQVKLDPSSTAAEATQNRIKFDKMNGVTSVVDWTGGTSYDFIDYFFKRATGFFDVVAYSGGVTSHAVNHNLGVTPEMYWVKCRSDGASNRGWAVYHKDISSPQDNYLRLDQTYAVSALANIFNGTIDASTFGVRSGYSIVNESGQTYIAYLFATVAGVSKVGSYTGTAADLDVDCGFTSGARFILIKRTDATGFWYVYDSVRGIVSGNDPFLLLDQTYAETTTTDYVDPLSSGFTVTSSASGSINTSGGEYIFLAIA